MRFNSLFPSFMACLVVVAGCGGSGSSGGKATTIAPPPPPMPPATAEYTAIELDPLPGDEAAAAFDVNDMGQIVGWSLKLGGFPTAAIWSVDASGAVAVQTLGYLPGGTQSIAIGINNFGQVVGVGDSAAGTRRAFIWTEDSGIRDLGAPVGMVGGQAHKVNDNGLIVGAVFETEFNSLTEQARLALWTVDQSGTVIGERNLGALGGQAAAGFDINSHGNVAGDIWRGPNQQSGFFWSEQGGVVEINAEEALGINDEDEVVGVRLGTGDDAYIWSESDGMVEFDGGIGSDINNAGQVTGKPNSENPAYIWENGEYKNLPMPDDRTFGWGLSINEAGWIAGWVEDADGNSHAVLWTPD